MAMDDLVNALAQNMVSRKRNEMEPYVLLVGAGASISSGCPTYEDLARAFLARFPDQYRAICAIEDGDEQRTQLMKAFSAEWRKTGETTRQDFLQEKFERAHAEAYNHLAWLLANGYVRIILSTNLDLLTEQALTNLKWVDGQEYKKIVNRPDQAPVVTELIRAASPKCKLVKLHGTVEEPGSYAWLDEECFQFEEQLGEVLNDLLNRDLVIIGSRMDGRDLDLNFQRDGGEIWFINPSPPREESRFALILKVRAASRALHGDEARADDLLRNLRAAIEGIESVSTDQAEPAINTFLRQLGYADESRDPRSRFLHLPELYSKPNEYDEIRNTLEDVGGVVIIGEPHMGKTYTALHLLWEYFQDGWTPVHLPRAAFQDKLRQCNNLLEEFAAESFQPKHVIHLDDPLGEISFEPLGGLEKGLAYLLTEAQRRPDVRLIITSRLTVLSGAYPRLESLRLTGASGVAHNIRVHTSYDEEILGDLFERYVSLYQPPWSADEAVVSELRQRAPTVLGAPHNIEFFVRTSTQYRDLSQLLAYLQKCKNMVAALADWIARQGVGERLFLFSVAWLSSEPRPDAVRIPPPPDGPPRCFRSLLARAFEDHRVLPPAVDPWRYYSHAFRSILVTGTPLQLTWFCHPSYIEAMNHAIRENEPTAGDFYFFVDWCLSHTEAWIREAVVAPTVAHYTASGPNAHAFLKRLTRDRSHTVRNALARELGGRWEKLNEADRKLLVRMSEDAEARYAVGSGLGGNYQNLDEAGRELLEAMAEHAEGREGIAVALAWNYDNLDEAGRELLERLADGPRARMGLATALGHRWENLDEAGRDLLALMAEDPEARGVLAHSLGRQWNDLDKEGRELLKRIAEDEQGRAGLVYNFYWLLKLDEEGWELFRVLAEEDLQSRQMLVNRLLRDYEKLGETLRELLARLLEEDPDAQAELSYKLGFNYESLDDSRRQLAERLTEKDPRAQRMFAAGLRGDQGGLDEDDRQLLKRLGEELQKDNAS